MPNFGMIEILDIINLYLDVKDCLNKIESLQLLDDDDDDDDDEKIPNTSKRIVDKW